MRTSTLKLACRRRTWLLVSALVVACLANSLAGCARTGYYVLDPRGLEGCRVASAKTQAARVRFDAAGGAVAGRPARLTGTTRDGEPFTAPLDQVTQLQVVPPAVPDGPPVTVRTSVLQHEPGWRPRGSVLQVTKADGQVVDVSGLHPRLDPRAGALLYGPPACPDERVPFREVAWVKVRHTSGTRTGLLLGFLGGFIGLCIGLSTMDFTIGGAQ